MAKIPKIIHYIWMGGGPKSELMLKCIESWKKFCPDFEIIEWNEKRFDVNSHPWVKKAVEQKNWVFASDVMRTWILCNHGGVYLDTDVEILKPIDQFCENQFFIGYESKYWFNSAVIGSIKGHPVMKKCIARYDKPCGDISIATNLNTLHAYGAAIQMIYGIVPNGKTLIRDGLGLYARDWFYPQHYLTYRTKITENSHMIHHYASTWHSKKIRRKFNMLRAARIVLGGAIFGLFERPVAKKMRKKLIKEMSDGQKG